MATKHFYDELRTISDTIWQAIFSNPFVKGIGDGSLSSDRYEFYLKQDYKYLIEFSRVFVLSIPKASLLKDMSWKKELLP